MAVQLLNGKLRFVLASTPNNPFTLFVKLKLKRPLDAFEGLVNVVICTGGAVTWTMLPPLGMPLTKSVAKA